MVATASITAEDDRDHAGRLLRGRVAFKVGEIDRIEVALDVGLTVH
jgi:hypothetical protein